MALSPGDRVPPFTVLRTDAEPVESAELWSGGPTVILYYVFDWSGADGG